jgi:hypothetical protein
MDSLNATAPGLDGAGGEGYIGLLSFLSFAFSVMAAVLAIDMYALLRTGRFGKTWRVLIIASVIFALMHALRMAELFNFSGLRSAHLSEVTELMFVMALAYAFYLQRQAFTRSAPPTDDHLPLSAFPPLHLEDDERAPALASEIAPREDEWARLQGQIPDHELSQPESPSSEAASSGRAPSTERFHSAPRP